METDRIYRTILHNMSEQVYVIDLDMNIVFINPASQRLTGWSPQEALGRKCYEVFGDEGWACRNSCPVTRAMSANLPIIHHKGRLKTRAGNLIDMQVSISPISEKDRVTGAAVVMNEITELKKLQEAEFNSMIALKKEIAIRNRQEKELNQANQLLSQERDIFVAGPVVVFKWKNMPGWPVEYVSPNVEEVFGYSREAFIKGGISYKDIICDKDIQKFTWEFEDNIKNGVQRFQHEPYRIKTNKNETIWVSDTKTILRSEDGRIQYYLGYVIDITIGIKAKLELAKSKERLEEILYSLPHGIFIVDAETHKIVDVNPQAALLIGAPAEVIIDKECHQFICPNEKGMCPITDLDKQLERSETVLLNFKKESLPILKSVIPIEIDDRRLLVESFVDISEQKEAEKGRLDQERLKAALETAGAICHELNQPLMSISGFSELIIDEIAQADPIYPFVKTIKEQSDRMGIITKKLMAITKYRTKDYLNTKIFDLDESVKK